MQVYILITDGFRAIIPKKAEENDLWSGRRSRFPTVVNQAGQYALFGGRAEQGELLEDTAKRELFEESGINIRNYNIQVKELKNTKEYTCFEFIVSADDFNQIHRSIDKNIINRDVKDGEMQAIVVTPLREVDKLLGVSQPISREVQNKINKAIRADRRVKWRHAIDWYQDIATECSLQTISTESRKEFSSPELEIVVDSDGKDNKSVLEDSPNPSDYERAKSEANTTPESINSDDNSQNSVDIGYKKLFQPFETINLGEKLNSIPSKLRLGKTVNASNPSVDLSKKFEDVVVPSALGKDNSNFYSPTLSERKQSKESTLEKMKTPPRGEASAFKPVTPKTRELSEEQGAVGKPDENLKNKIKPLSEILYAAGMSSNVSDNVISPMSHKKDIPNTHGRKY